MTIRLNKGDVCSLEVVVQYVDHGSTLVKIESAKVAHTVPTSALTLVRRAPVDLATCDLSEPVAVVGSDGRGKLLGRYGELAWVWRDNGYETVRLDTLRPLDASAPESEVERLRAQIDGMTGTIARLSTRLYEVFASTAPSCPPGHVLIETSEFEQLVKTFGEVLDVLRKEAPGTPLNNHKYVDLGIVANRALTKARALIAPTKREGV